MINPVLTWALRILKQSTDTSVSGDVSQALKLVGVDKIEINAQSLESIFSAVALNDESPAIAQKRLSWQALDTNKIVYPTERAKVVPLDIPEPRDGWGRFDENDNLALALIEKYGTFLSISPSVPYLSFYDAVKSAAAIHDCLVHGRAESPFLMVSGDFSGIQEAIYTIASSGALKTLRARSFMIELLTEHIIYEIQRATGCGRHNVIFSGGGGFCLLVPNTEESQSKINAFTTVINEWTFEQFGFQLFIALHCEPLTVDSLESNPFKEMWESVTDKLAKQKRRKFWNSRNFKDLFSPKMPKQLTNQDACQITHRDDLPRNEMVPSPLGGDGKVSKLAFRLWRLGDQLTEFDCIVRLLSSEENFRDGTLLFPTHQEDKYAAYKSCSFSQIQNFEARWLVNSWDLDKYDNKTFPFLFGDYVRSVADLPDDAQKHEREEYRRDHDNKEMNNPKGITASFSGLAKAAQGSELIGCLRMDVDNSGEFFSAGKFNLGLGIAVSSNLSRSMNLFFKGYLNQICGMNLGVNFTKKNYPIDITGKKTGEKASKSKGRDVSIVYAGGDDLFIVGAWDDVAELAFDINACFREFSCWHREVHLSGGVTLHKPKFPLYQMARMAKRAEDAAKANEDNEKREKKNSLSLFFNDDLKRRNRSLNEHIIEENRDHGWGQQLDRIAIASRWDEFDNAIQLTRELHEVYAEIPHGFYQKLFQTLKIWQEDGLLYLPMMSHTQRQLDRIPSPTPTVKSLKTLLTTLFAANKDNMRTLHIPLQWVEYLNRHS